MKIRIALAVDATGDWCASGWGNLTDGKDRSKDAMDIAVDATAPGEARYWIDLEVEAPVVPTIQAEAKAA